MVVPEHVFEMASRLWEPPDELACEEFEVEFVTDSSGALRVVGASSAHSLRD